MTEVRASDPFELVRKAQEGDGSALGTLYERYVGRVRKIVRLRLRLRLRRLYDSLDIVNESFVIAIEKFDRFEMKSEAGLINWLAKIAEHSIRNKAGRKSAWVVRAIESIAVSQASGEIKFDPEAKIELPVDLAAKNEKQRTLEESIRELPDQYRDVIILRNIARPPGSKQDVPWKIVGEELGLSEDAARMLHARARVELSEILVRKRAAKE